METQTSRIVFDLSQLIIRGELAPDEIVVETAIAERFGVSRTPVRQAMAILNEEGLLQKSSGRSYKVRRFAHQEIVDAIEVRGVLEGLAARNVTEHKGGLRVLRDLDACLAREAKVLSEMESQGLTPELMAQYYSLNTAFHGTIVQGSQNEALAGALAIANRIPFVSVGSLARYREVIEPQDAREELHVFIYSHMQHREIVDAIRAGQGGRAEAIMREHAQLGVRHIHLDSASPLRAVNER